MPSVDHEVYLLHGHVVESDNTDIYVQISTKSLKGASIGGVTYEGSFLWLTGQPTWFQTRTRLVTLYLRTYLSRIRGLEGSGKNVFSLALSAALGPWIPNSHPMKATRHYHIY